MKTLHKLTTAALVIAVAVAFGMPAKAAADVNDFTFQSFEADYYLSRDSEQRSRLDVTERLIADFPSFDQNHGIERAIPDLYDGHTVGLEIVSVTDDLGQTRTYTTYGSNGNTVLRIGDADRYVQGEQTYVIRYRLRDVTKGFTAGDEINWDTNGVDWRQPFGSVTARLHIPGELASAFDGRTKCYVGAAGSTEQCGVSKQQTDTTLLLTYASGRRLEPGENVTFVAGFEPNTFVPYQKTFWEKLLPILIAIWAALNAAALAAAAYVTLKATRRYGRSAAGRGTTVPEYIPPKGVSVMVNAAVLGRTEPAVTAQIIDLAVRHYLKIYEVESTSWFKKKHSYEIELIKDVAGLQEEESQVVSMLFGEGAAVGQRVALDSLKAKLYQQAAEQTKDAYKKAAAQGFFEDVSRVRKRYYKIGGITTALGVLLLAPGAAIGGIAMLITVSTWKPLTEEGAALKEYLRGLKMYMDLAEADRLRQLQSPEGAARTGGIDVSDHRQLVKLYERLLPYAMLFGIEKEWLKQFAPLYEQPPEWYGGNWAAFNAATLASSFDGFSSASRSAFTPPSSSSSSGFSGGSSGGGGGGGGGGGW